MSVTVQYQASAEAALEAVFSSLKKRGYTFDGHDKQKMPIVFEPHDIIWWIRSLGFRMKLEIVPLENERVDITLKSNTTIDLGETEKVTGKVFHDLDQLLGAGTLLKGKFIRPDAASEMKRFLFVFIFFIVAIALFFLFAKLKGVI